MGFEETITQIDNEILHWLESVFACTFLDAVMPWITVLGNIGVVWIAVGIAMLCTKKYRRYGFLLLIALAITAIVVNLLIKPFVYRLRPCDVDPSLLTIPRPSGMSFPSGHSSSSFAAAVILWAANRKFGIAAYILATLISFSRLYLYVHYPSDVVVGILIGILFAVLTLAVDRHLQKQASNQVLRRN